MVYPEHLQIETVAGICTAKCIMCPIDESPRNEIMSNEKFEKIIDAFLPMVKNLKFTTLHGLGEPLLDKNIAHKIAYAKSRNFPSVGFATNGTNLNEKLARSILLSGLDTIIFSIDGFKKETHEKIRLKVNYDEVIQNVLNFISLRNKEGKTKIIVRMIKQEANKNEWNDYYNFWSKELNNKFGDQVSSFDVHNWGGKDFNLSKQLKEISKRMTIKCTDLHERMFVYVNGEVGFCCGDDTGWFQNGNVLEDEPLEIFNRGKFKEYREAMKNGKISELKHCNNCSIIFSRLKKEYLDIT